MQSNNFTWLDYFFAVLDFSTPALTYLFGTVFVVWVLGHRRGPAQRFFAACEKVFATFARVTPPPILYGLSFSSGFGVSLLLFLCARRPVADVHDELAYLLAADTFAHGRLTNPSPPHYQHFEALELILRPTYMGKYPPGQGFILALGQLLGDPVIGLWISAGLVCMVAFWTLQAFTRRDTALGWSFLVAIHPAVMKWTQIYWGGNVALVGGLLVLGSVKRIVDSASNGSVGQFRFRAGDSICLGVGFAVLAISRPFEGALFAILCCVPLLKLLPPLWHSTSEATYTTHFLRCFVLPLMLMLSLTVVFIGTFNKAVTGNPFIMPYMIHEEQYAPVPNFLWQKLRDGHDFPVLMRQDPSQYVMSYLCVRYYAGQKGTLSNLWSGVTDKYKILFHSAFQMFDPSVYEQDRDPPTDKPTRLASAAAVLLLPGFLVAMAAKRRITPHSVNAARTWWNRWGAITLLFFFICLLQETYMNPHYGAPAGGMVLLIWVQSWRHLRTVRFPFPSSRIPLGTHRLGLSLSRFFILICFASCIRCFYGFGLPNAQNVSKREVVVNFLRRNENATRKHLVLVYYGPMNNRYPMEWVYNSSDITAQDIIWARYLTPNQNKDLLGDERFTENRQIWLVWIDSDSTARLYKYDPSRFRKLPQPPPQVFPSDLVQKIIRGDPPRDVRVILKKREELADRMRKDEIDSAIRVLTATPPVLPPLTQDRKARQSTKANSAR